MTSLGHRDYDGALTLVAEAAGLNGRQPFELPTIERLRELIPADRAGYYETRSNAPGNIERSTTRIRNDGVKNCLFVYFLDQPAGPNLDWYGELVETTISSWPLSDRRLGTPPPIALKLSDFLTRAQQRRNPWYCEIMRPEGVEYQCTLRLPAPNGTTRGFFLARGADAPDFDERDRTLLTLLRPHLATIRERWQRRRRPPQLTAREAEILQLVGEGLTNAQIAARPS